MRLWVATLTALALATGVAHAQSTKATLTGITCPGAGCVTVLPPTMGQIAVQIVGPYDGVSVFERSVDGVTWAPWPLTSSQSYQETSTIGTGIWTGVTDGSTRYRVRLSAYWGGAAVTSINFASAGDGNFTAHYVLSQADPSLTNAQVLGELAPGLLKVAITPGDNPLGTLMPAVPGTDYLAPSGSYSDPSWLTALAWAKVTGKPTTVSGYGITDGVATGGSYNDPTWLTALAWAKVTGKPTTLSGYGITDAISTSGSYSDPAWITALAWSKINGTPTTVSGYGITDLYARGTLTDSNPFTWTQTWNDGSEQFFGFNVDITDTASAASSSYVRMRVGVNRIFDISKNGQVNFGAHAIYFGNSSNYYGQGTSLTTTNNTLIFNATGQNYNFGAGAVDAIVGSFQGQAGMQFTGSGTALCLRSTNVCRFNHNTTSGGWESTTLPVTAIKLGGVTQTPTVTGDATKNANSFDVQGKVTSTATGSVTITVTFGTAYAVAPSCFATNETAGTHQRTATTTTALTITGSATTGDVIAYACIGR